MKITFKVFFLFLFCLAAIKSNAEDTDKNVAFNVVTSLNGLELRIAQLGFSGEIPTKTYQTAQNYFKLDDNMFQFVIVSKQEFLNDEGGNHLLQYKKWEQAHHIKLTNNNAQFQNVVECKNKEFKTISWEMKTPKITRYNSISTVIDLDRFVLNIVYFFSNEDEKNKSHKKIQFFCNSMKRI